MTWMIENTMSNFIPKYYSYSLVLIHLDKYVHFSLNIVRGNNLSFPGSMAENSAILNHLFISKTVLNEGTDEELVSL